MIFSDSFERNDHAVQWQEKLCERLELTVILMSHKTGARSKNKRKRKTNSWSPNKDGSQEMWFRVTFHKTRGTQSNVQVFMHPAAQLASLVNGNRLVLI